MEYIQYRGLNHADLSKSVLKRQVEIFWFNLFRITLFFPLKRFSDDGIVVIIGDVFKRMRLLKDKGQEPDVVYRSPPPG